MRATLLLSYYTVKVTVFTTAPSREISNTDGAFTVRIECIDTGDRFLLPKPMPDWDVTYFNASVP